MKLNLLDNAQINTLEERLYIIATLFATTGCTVGLVTFIIGDVSAVISFLVFLVDICFLGLYYLAKFRQKPVLFKQLLFLLGFLGIGFGWFCSDGLYGTASYYFFISTIIFLFLLQTGYYLVLFITIALGCVFIAIQVYFPQTIMPYPSQEIRFFDFIFTFIAGLVIIGFTSIFVKQTMDNERQIIEKQKEDIEKKNQSITASITYALRIQKAIIPKENEIQKHFPESFVFFRPKNIVSGDFYWFADKGNTKIIAVADCTGHGVSGAFMTMIGNNILNQIVHTLEIHTPDEILNLMSPLLEKTLLHSDGKVKDGMDISIISIKTLQDAENQQKLEVVYAGAMNPLYYVQNSEFVEIKADKVPIGSSTERENFSYTKHEISINSPTSLYLLSDGYQDQFGGEENRKFMVGKFKKLLLEISDKPMSGQKQILEQRFDAWKENKRQTDDVLVMGIRV